MHIAFSLFLRTILSDAKNTGKEHSFYLASVLRQGSFIQDKLKFVT